MATLAVAESMQQLKSLYRHYAAIHHPDKGGCHVRMQELNRQYQAMKERLKTASNDEGLARNDFSNIVVGCKLYVNNTPCEVLAVSEQYFTAVAIGRNRQALFDKTTGLGRFNSKIQASFQLRYVG